MKPIYILLFTILLPHLTHAQSKAQLKEEIAKVVHFDTEITHDKIPGYVIGIIVGDSMFTYGYGQIAKEIEQTPDENSLFEIGSVTKLFTASLVGLLADEGLFSHDTPLNECLPEEYRNAKLDYITIGSLLTHTSSLPKIPSSIGVYEAETNNPYAHYSKELLLDYYADFVPDQEYLPVSEKKKKRKSKKSSEKKSPKAKQIDYIYSHVNYALLEVAMEQLTGQSYEALLKDRLFNKIGMSQSLTQFNSEEEEEQLTPGYARNGLKAAPWKFASFEGSQGVKSTAIDLLQFLKIHMENPSDTLSLSLYNNTLPAVQTGLTENGAMGYGWHILHQKKFYDIMLHAGSTGGHRAFIGFVRETKTGVVVLSNSEHSTGGLGYLLLRLINFNWSKSKAGKMGNQ